MAAESDLVCPKNFSKILINFGEICRFCLTETQNEICMKDKCLSEGPTETEHDTIYSFVTKFKIIKVNNIENFPSLVCRNCYEVIKICYNFTKVCQKSENLLSACYEKAIKEAKEKLNILNNELIEFPDKNLEETNCQAEEIVKSQEIGSEKNIILISEQLNEFSENLKPSSFSGGVGSLPGSKIYCCSLCSLKFSNLESLNFHYMYTHEKYQCSICLEIFTEQENLITHYKTTHKQVGECYKEDPNDTKSIVDVKALFCFYCTPFKEFQTEEDLLNHRKCHELDSCYNCPNCEDKFSSKLSLSQHLVDLHNLTMDAVPWTDVRFQKQDCTGMDNEDGHPLKFHSITGFLSLHQDKSKDFQALCKNCNPSLNFSTTDDFIMHMTSHHSNAKLLKNWPIGNKTGHKNNSNWKCSDCPATYSQKQSLFSHMRQKHNKQHPESMKCPDCSKTFLTNRKLIQHGIAAHQTYFANFHKVFRKIIQPSHEEIIQSKNFECDICQKRYIFKTSLKKHIFSAHLGESKDSVNCPYCGKTLANKLNLKSHIEFIHEALFVSCPICRKKINFRTIGRHYKVHQNSSEIGLKNSYLCTQCGKILKSKRSFEDHQKLHKNIRNELCDVCGSGYATKKALRLHKKTHEGGQRKLHKCDQCDKVFSGRHTLNRHLLTHSGVKNFICEICSKRFYTLQELNRHVRYHKKEYRFECQQCDMRFVDKSRFRHHLMKHKNIRPHKCQFCEKMFIVRGKMNLHMASKHNVQVDSRRVWKDPKAYIPLDELL